MRADVLASEPVGARRSRPRRGSASSRRRGWRAVLFLLPATLVYVVFLIYPLFKSLAGSFFDWRGIRRGGFVGLDNYVELFSGRSRSLVTNAALNNTIWFFVIFLVQNVLGLVIAYVLFLRGRRYAFFQSWFFFPAILSPVLVGALWRLLLSPNGPLDTVLMSAGLTDGPLTLLGNSSTALTTVMMVDVWNWIGLPILIFLAGFHAISPEVLEAARLDGASAGRILWQVAFPLLIPALSTLTVLSLINSYSQFDLVYVMQGVQGDPNHATDTLVTLFYRLAFGDSSSVGLTDIGLALSLGMLLFVFLVGLSLLGIRFFNRRSVELGT